LLLALAVSWLLLTRVWDDDDNDDEDDIVDIFT
jgi:hypothetical protein